jgi:hypothetical protein
MEREAAAAGKKMGKVALISDPYLP